MATQTTVHAHHSQHFEDLQLSAKEFYMLVKNMIEAYQYPDVTCTPITLSESGIFSSRREYLRISKQRYHYYVCASPFGRSFFIPYASDVETPYIADIIEHSRAQYCVPTQSQPVSASVQPTTVPKPLPIMNAPVVPVEIDSETSNPKQETIREHRYLQTFIKAMAEAQGYRASLEVPTPDGKGFVDVVVEKAEQSIAVEISVTTNAEWELHNIKKCLKAGYPRVILCLTQTAKLSQLEKHIVMHLSADEQAIVQVITPSDIQTLFEDQGVIPLAETLMKGYRVKVNYEPNVTRQGLLQSIINATKK